MIANVGPADYNYDETISSLRYADRAKSIKNHAIINEDPKDALLRQLQKQIDDLKKQLDDGVDYSGGGNDSDYEGGSDDEIYVDADGKKVRRKKSK